MKETQWGMTLGWRLCSYSIRFLPVKIFWDQSGLNDHVSVCTLIKNHKIQSLVRELRSHKLSSQKEKKEVFIYYEFPTIQDVVYFGEEISLQFLQW